MNILFFKRDESIFINDSINCLTDYKILYPVLYHMNRRRQVSCIIQANCQVRKLRNVRRMNAGAADMRSENLWPSAAVHSPLGYVNLYRCLIQLNVHLLCLDTYLSRLRQSTYLLVILKPLSIHYFSKEKLRALLASTSSYMYFKHDS